MPIRVLVVDDEPLARRRIVRLLRNAPDVDVVAECAGGEEAVEALKTQEVDLVFLDVQMPDVDGFGVVRQVGAGRMPAVIFVTAYDEYALRAFEVHAFDYLLKPVDAERFQAAFDRTRAHLATAESARTGQRLKALLSQVLANEAAGVPAAGGMGEPVRFLDRLMIKHDGRVTFVKVSDVEWFEAAGNYIRVHVGPVTHIIRQTMSELERSLPPGQFARIHRTTIVNLDQIRELQPWFAGDHVVILRDGTQLKLSRTYRDQLHARIQRTP